ncbi:hypothetical protein LX36DRAFT_462657 [Colletotrichum falcatum]|nr:hypothetical protein LX36DRAFT_462657 [Colletotrichum falcatum]
MCLGLWERGMPIEVVRQLWPPLVAHIMVPEKLPAIWTSHMLGAGGLKRLEGRGSISTCRTGTEMHVWLRGGWRGNVTLETKT